MNSWVAVTPEAQKSKRWRSRDAFQYAVGQQTADILLPELSSLLPHYTLCFVQQEDSYRIVALLGLGGERNLYINQENYWMCPYVPATLRSYPFALANYNDSGDKVLCIQEAHITEDSDANAFFDDEGGLAPATAEVFNFLKQCERSRLQTQSACDSLAEAEIIEPWPLHIKRGEDDKEPITIDGLHRISETKLNGLAESDFMRLRESGALPLAYAQLFSEHQYPQLGQRADYLTRQLEESSARLDLGGIFEEEGSLNFDSL